MVNVDNSKLINVIIENPYILLFMIYICSVWGLYIKFYFKIPENYLISLVLLWTHLKHQPEVPKN